MSTFGNPPTTQKSRDGRAMQALLVSVALHVAALIIIPATTAPGVPGGKGRLTRTDVFTLGYIGEWDDRHDGQPASNLGVSAVFGSGQGKTADKESNSKKVEAAAVPRVTMDVNKKSTTPAVSGASRVETAKTLTSAKGVFAVPAEDKEKPSGNPAPPKDKSGSAESEIQAADGHGAAGVVTGKGTGPNPPPNGASLLQVGTIPTYPKNAANEGVEGVVGLRIHASGEGKISTVEVSRPSGDKRLDDIAVRTVIKYWRLKPFSQDYVLNVAVRFKGGAKVDLDYGEVEFASPEA